MFARMDNDPHLMRIRRRLERRRRDFARARHVAVATVAPPPVLPAPLPWWSRLWAAVVDALYGGP